MSIHVDNPAETPPENSTASLLKRPSKSSRPYMDKQERRYRFNTALSQGHPIAQASRIAGINPNTGTVWARQWKENRVKLAQSPSSQAESDLVTPDGIDAMLRSIAADTDQSGSYRVAALKALQDRQTGCPRPCCASHTPYKGTLDWLASLPTGDGIEGWRAGVMGAGGPPKENDVDAVQSPPKHLPDQQRAGSV